LPHITYYHCHVGHQFSPQSLAAAQAETAEAKLWAAVAALEETAALAGHAEAEEDLARQRDGTRSGQPAWPTRCAL
jgi:two-component system chemotaxis response regulator CheB